MIITLMCYIVDAINLNSCTHFDMYKITSLVANAWTGCLFKSCAFDCQLKRIGSECFGTTCVGQNNAHEALKLAR